MVLGYFIFRFRSWDGFKLFLYSLSASPETVFLDARGGIRLYFNMTVKIKTSSCCLMLLNTIAFFWILREKIRHLSLTAAENIS